MPNVKGRAGAEFRTAPGASLAIGDPASRPGLDADLDEVLDAIVVQRDRFFGQRLAVESEGTLA